MPETQLEQYLVNVKNDLCFQGTPSRVYSMAKTSIVPFTSRCLATRRLNDGFKSMFTRASVRSGHVRAELVFGASTASKLHSQCMVKADIFSAVIRCTPATRATQVPIVSHEVSNLLSQAHAHLTTPL